LGSARTQLNAGSVSGSSKSISSASFALLDPLLRDPASLDPTGLFARPSRDTEETAIENKDVGGFRSSASHDARKPLRISRDTIDLRRLINPSQIQLANTDAIPHSVTMAHPLLPAPEPESADEPSAELADDPFVEPSIATPPARSIHPAATPAKTAIAGIHIRSSVTASKLFKNRRIIQIIGSLIGSLIASGCCVLIHTSQGTIAARCQHDRILISS